MQHPSWEFYWLLRVLESEGFAEDLGSTTSGNAGFKDDNIQCSRFATIQQYC
jgi:hypothetical protein